MSPTVDVALEVEGRRFTGWSGIEIQSAMDAIASTFTLEVESRTETTFPIEPGQACRVLVDGEVLIDGHIDAARGSVDAEEHSAQVAGRDRTAELVDCSALNEPGEWWGLTLPEIATELAAPFGVDVEFENADFGPAFERFAVNPGETAFEALDRACKLRGVLASGRGGVLVLTTPGAGGRAIVDVVQGENLEAGTVEVDHTGRFRDYIVRGQLAGGEDLAVEEFVAIEGRAQDLAARAGRRLLLIAEGQVSYDSAADRAAWECATRAARGTRWSVRLAGFRQTKGGPLWRPNVLVVCRMPALLVPRGELLVTAVRYKASQGDDGGTRVELALARADAFKAAPLIQKAGEPAEFGADVEGSSSE